MTQGPLRRSERGGRKGLQSEQHGAAERVAAVVLGAGFVAVGAISILKGEAGYATVLLIAVAAPLIYLGLGYTVPPINIGNFRLGTPSRKAKSKSPPD